ncbi:MAG: hypothetical protein WDO71_05395 [Bacteroidota bacterium]
MTRQTQGIFLKNLCQPFLYLLGMPGRILKLAGSITGSHKMQKAPNFFEALRTGAARFRKAYRNVHQYFTSILKAVSPPMASPPRVH